MATHVCDRWADEGNGCTVCRALIRGYRKEDLAEVAVRLSAVERERVYWKGQADRYRSLLSDTIEAAIDLLQLANPKAAKIMKAYLERLQNDDGNHPFNSMGLDNWDTPVDRTGNR